MLFTGINIKKELVRHRSHNPDILREINDLFVQEQKLEKEIAGRLKKNNPHSCLEITPKDAQNIFTLEDIRHVCVRYRLRFLESGHFKPEYPFEALTEIKAFEKKYDVKIESFRIVAPAGAFELKNINKDPLLFAQLNHKTYYLLHQWGSDMKWYRKIIAWPLQNLKTMLFSLLAIGCIFSFSLPDAVMNVFTFQSSMYLRIWLSIHTFIALTGLTLWAGLAFDKTFSELNWDSKYYNY
jgi:hypothetical protein